jgi:hypothetical protein
VSKASTVTTYARACARTTKGLKELMSVAVEVECPCRTSVAVTSERSVTEDRSREARVSEWEERSRVARVSVIEERTRMRGAWMPAAVEILKEHPTWPIRWIAKRIGVHHSQLSRSAAFRAAVEVARGTATVRQCPDCVGRGLLVSRTGSVETCALCRGGGQVRCEPHHPNSAPERSRIPWQKQH